MKKSGWSAIWQQKQYVLAGTLVIIAAIGTTVYYGTREEKQREQMESEIVAEMTAENDNQVAEADSVEESEQQDAAVVSSIIPPETVQRRPKRLLPWRRRRRRHKTIHCIFLLKTAFSGRWRGM